MIPVSYETHKAAGDHAGELCLSSHRAGLHGRDAHGGVVSSFAANLPAAYLARNPGIRERGAVFHFLGGQADFFVILVVVPLAAGVLLLGIAGRLCRLVHGRE